MIHVCVLNWCRTYHGQEGESELEEVERQLGAGKPPAKSGSKAALNGGDGAEKGRGAGLKRLLPPVLLEAFVLTFLAEWGDRSQVKVASDAQAHSWASHHCHLMAPRAEGMHK